MARTMSLALCLFAICGAGMVRADDAAAKAGGAAPPVAQTVQRAIGYVQAESASWLKSRGCAACHHVPLVLWSLSEAERRGYAVDKKFVAETLEGALGSHEKLIAAKLAAGPNDPPDTRPLAKGVNMGQAYMAAIARMLPALTAGQKETVQWIADDIVKKQHEDGSWDFFLRRPPINESQTSDTAWILLALVGGADEPESHRAALAKGAAWLASAKLPNDQDKALKLLVASRLGKSRDEMQASADELFALQRADGGWSQLAELPSDAYATGQALYVLALAGNTADRPEMKRAIAFLTSTQKADGSWPVTSRSTPDGKPGGAKLLTPITCAAGSWATLGLVSVVPKGPVGGEVHHLTSP